MPVGCNPSGCSHSLERKRAVLEVCKKYNLLIMEGEYIILVKCSFRADNDFVTDDPYCELTIRCRASSRYSH